MSNYKKLAQDFYGFAAKGDIDSLRALYAEDATVWHNTDQVKQSVEENLQGVAMFANTVEQLNFAVERFDELPNGYVQEHVVRGELANGNAVAIYACNVVRVKDGKITELREYIDTAQVAPIFEA